MLDALHALDLLEMESNSIGLSYKKRAALFAKKVGKLVAALIEKFSNMRQKHKDFAKENREMWGKEVEMLQQQTDELSADLEAVMEQAQFYLTAYKTQVVQLTSLAKAQNESFVHYQEMKQTLIQVGVEYNTTTQLRSYQLRKFQELSHYLTYGNVPYTEDIFAFGCDGILGSSASFDLCKVCGGDNSTCADCAGTPNGPLQVDICGVCGGNGDSCNYFCDRVPDSGLITDLCGECGGNSSLCVGCDGFPNSGVVLDECGVCAGDGSSCDVGNEYHVNRRATFSPAIGQTLIITRCEMHTEFTDAWNKANQLLLRSAFAEAVEGKVESTQIMFLGGTTSIVFSMGVLVNEPETGITVTMIRKFIREGGLNKYLTTRGISNGEVSILEGPTIVRGSDGTPPRQFQP
jgi:hypothetical protein